MNTDEKRIRNRLMALNMQTNDRSERAKDIVADILQSALNWACVVNGCDETHLSVTLHVDACRSEGSY